MIKLSRKEDCCGCGACVQKCPHNCISMNEDEEGYLYPTINEQKCIDCKLCEIVCPILNGQPTPSSPKVYAAKNYDNHIREESSSGGLFVEFAKKVVSRKGVVFGAVFNQEYEVVHTYTLTKEGLLRLLRSKYVQSRIGDSYRDVLKFLNEGKLVLFSGTPCQIAGLKSYLRKDYSNLITIEVVCHGVPSPGLWRRYLKELQVNKGVANITGIVFREKKGYSWEYYGMKIAGEETPLFLDYASKNSFMRAFLTNICIRPICYECRHKRGKSGADITLGDFWGIDKVAPSFKDDSGVSMVVINTEKGNELFTSINVNKVEIDYNLVKNCNRSYYLSSPKPLNRNKFFNLLNCSAMTFDETVRKIIPRQSELSYVEKLFALPQRGYRFILRHILKKNI